MSESGIRLDISGKGPLGEGITNDSLEAVADEIRRPFVDFIERLSDPYGANLDWWVTAVASRNTYASSLYLSLCRLVLARRMLESGRVAEVHTASSALAKVLALVSGGTVRISVAGTAWGRRLSQGWGVIRRFGAACFHLCCQWFCARIFLHGRAPLPVEPIVLVDTFLYADSIARAQVRDRHYPGMLDQLNSSEQGRVFFAPSYYGIRNYAVFFRALAKAQANLVLKENFLRLRDYVFALSHPFRLRWPNGPIEFLGIDVALLVREALVECSAGSGAIEGLLRYRFAQRLRERGVRVIRIIEWFENQEIDHGSNAGWRTFFPEVLVVGFQGFLASRHYLCMFPTAQESELRLIPNRVAVMGSVAAGAAREFFPDMRVDVAPALRFASVWQERSEEPDASRFTVLVSLPILRADWRMVFQLAREAANQNLQGSSRPWRFWVKPHPGTGKRDIDKLAAVLPAGFTLERAEFGTLLDRSDALVGAASSTCVHAIARGVPVAIAAAPAVLVQNPIPRNTDSLLWSVCYTSTELSATLRRYASSDARQVARRRQLGSELRVRLFEPVTRDSVRCFLGLDSAPPEQASRICR